MLRRLVTLGISFVLLTGCGGQSDGRPAQAVDPSATPRPAGTIGPDDAETAFGVVADLDDAWKKRDCTKILFLTTSAESELGGRACEATRNGRPAPARPEYSDIDYFFAGQQDERPWFVALARKPQPAYFVLAYEEDYWRLAYGPVRVLGKAAEPDADQAAMPTGDPDTEVRARLVPQKHLAFLSDPAGVSGVPFATGDPMRALLAELVRKPATVRPDRLTSDVQLVPGAVTALGLKDGGALVFHALKIVHTQKAASRKLAHPLYGASAVRAFTGKASPATVRVTEIVVLATQVAANGKLTTVALTRGLADITT